MTQMNLVGKNNCVYLQDSDLIFDLFWKTSADAVIRDLVLRCTFYHQSGAVAAFTTVGLGNSGPNEEHYNQVIISLSGIVPGSYYLTFDMNEVNADGSDVWNDSCEQVTTISIEKNQQQKAEVHSDHSSMIPWKHSVYGSVRLYSSIIKERREKI